MQSINKYLKPFYLFWAAFFVFLFVWLVFSSFADLNNLWLYQGQRVMGTSSLLSWKFIFPLAAVCLFWVCYLLDRAFEIKIKILYLEIGVLILLGIFYFRFSTKMPFGDALDWLNDFQPAYKELFGSSLLAHMIMRAVYLSGKTAFFSIYPLLGLWTVISYFMCLRKIESHFRREGEVSLLMGGFTRCLFVGWAFHLCFVKYYVEVSQLSIPLFLTTTFLFLDFLEKETMSSLLIAMVAYTITCTTHGVWTYLFPAFVLTTFFIKPHFIKKNWKGALSSTTLLPAIIVAAVCKGAYLMGFTVFQGDIFGGDDNQIFVQWYTEGCAFCQFPFFSSQHIIFIGNLLLLAVAPLVVQLGPWVSTRLVAIINERRMGDEAPTREPRSFLNGIIESENKVLQDPYFVFLFWASMGFFAFISIFNFDLGFPRDYDLMTIMSVMPWLFSAYMLYAFSFFQKPVFLVLFSLFSFYPWLTFHSWII